MFNKKSVAIALLAILSLGVGSAYACQEEGKGPQNMQERMQKHHERLHDKLKITPQQEPAWQAFIQATKPEAHAMKPEGNNGTLSAPEKMEKHLAMQKHHQAMMEKHLAALKTLYPQLNADQQKILDQEMGRHMGMGKKHRKHH